VVCGGSQPNGERRKGCHVGKALEEGLAGTSPVECQVGQMWTSRSELLPVKLLFCDGSCDGQLLERGGWVCDDFAILLCRDRKGV
jgi:hypothetical protein